MTPIEEIEVLDHGIVALMSVDGDDRTAANTARTSYRNQEGINPKNGVPYTDAENAGLTDYLIRKHHSSPIEFATATFYMVMPIFVARQFIRHRTSVVNEESLRYVEARNQFYVPALDRMQRQSTDNKQGSSATLVDDPARCVSRIRYANEHAYGQYQALLDEGLSKELARTVLPLGTYTAWYWKANLHNILHLLRLRLDPHAQYEIRVYAEAMLDLLRPHFPTTIASWENHVNGAVTFSRDEQTLLAAMLNDLVKDSNESKHYLTEAMRYEYGDLPRSRQREFLAKLTCVLEQETL